ncbi:MAG: hypothetical protein J6R61_01190 [Bacteroidales bacterium]|nr:hypothetical protein [Bacteroidales bacterium]
MKEFEYNRLRADYLQLALMTISYFILNFEDMILHKGRYAFDLTVCMEGKQLLLSAVYQMPSSQHKDSKFYFQVKKEDVDLKLIIDGNYDVACSYVKDIIDEYLRRVKK